MQSAVAVRRRAAGSRTPWRCDSASGSQRMAASPATSGSDDRLEAIEGVPHAIASRSGRPNPSYSDGMTKQSAAEYQRGKSSCGTKSTKRSRSPRLASATARPARPIRQPDAPGMHEIVRDLVFHLGECANQGGQVLAWLASADRQDERTRQLVAMRETRRSLQRVDDESGDRLRAA